MKVGEITKGNRIKSINICSCGEIKNPASQMYFCKNLGTVDMLFDLSSTSVAFVLY